MATDNKRFTVSITDDMANQLNELKKNEFYDKNQSDMIRHIIRLGLQAKQDQHVNTQAKTAV